MSTADLASLTDQLPAFRGSQLLTWERAGHWTATLTRGGAFVLSFGGATEQSAVDALASKLSAYVAARRAA